MDGGVAALNHLASPFLPPSAALSSESSATHVRVHANLHAAAVRFVDGRPRDADGAAVVDSKYFGVPGVDADPSLTAVPYASRAFAVRLVAARVSLPDAGAGMVSMADSLPPDMAAEYASPDRCLAPAAATQASGGRKARVFASHREYVLLLLRMARCNMISYTRQPRRINGLFGVPKDGDAIRLILDARPANDAFVPPPHVSLPTPDLLAKLQAPSGSDVWVAKSDLADFFYRFATPEWMWPWFALPAVAPAAVGLGHLWGDEPIYPCLRVLAMGWSHSVRVAQSAHERLVLLNTPFRRRDFITRDNDLLVDRVRLLLYIDDVCVIGTEQQAVDAALLDYKRAAEANQFVIKDTKLKHASRDGMECIGVEVHGRTRVVGLRLDKLHQLCDDTRRVLGLGKCTGRGMAQLIGRWTWAMLVTRPALSCFSAVYRFIEMADHWLFGLWPTVAAELQSALCIAPLLHTTIDALWWDRVVACDASLKGQGVVAAPAPAAAVAAAAAHSGVLVDADASVEAGLNAPLLAAPWRVIVSSRWRAVEHINKLELRSISTTLRWVASFPSSTRRRVLLLSDSQVAVGALSKGRSSSFALLVRLRPISALLLATGVQLHTRWLASHLNPADAPSRAFD